MSQQELVRDVITRLEAAGIKYMVTGSLASSLQGEPRLTHDLDLVVTLDGDDVEKIIGTFPKELYYVDGRTILEAIQKRSMFNVISFEHGDKIDFWMLTDEPFDQSRFSRRYEEDFLGIKLTVSRPEDTILAKLRWAKLSGGSEKQFIDALRIFEVQGDVLDLKYIDLWSKRLNVEDYWEQILKEKK